jgi:hypothetical protein
VSTERANPRVVVRHSEDTIPGRLTSPEPRLSNAELSQTRKLVWLISALALAFALIGIVLFQLLIHAIRGNVAIAGPGQRSAECSEGAVPDGCGDGFVCRGQYCVPDDYEAPSGGQTGDNCGTADDAPCRAGLQCVGGQCAAPEPAVDVCERPAVVKALANLKAKCAGDIDVCPKSDLKKYAIDNPDFDQLMSEFPGTVTMHFPTGSPPLSKRDKPWPTAEVRKYYLDKLAAAMPTLRKARHVFIISRSSSGGDSRRNDAFAQARSTLTKNLILETLVSASDGDVLLRDTMRGKFADFLLGPQKQIDVALFRNRYANRAITWSEKAQRMLGALIQKETVTPEDEQWRNRVINQVVFVVPVPCELGLKEQG